MPRAAPPRPVACHVRDTVKNNPRAFWCIRISIECSGSAERESATDDANRAATVPRAAPPRPVACHVRDTVKNNPRAFWCIGIECSAERESATMMPTIAIGANSISRLQNDPFTPGILAHSIISYQNTYKSLLKKRTIF